MELHSLHYIVTVGEAGDAKHYVEAHTENRWSRIQSRSGNQDMHRSIVFGRQRVRVAESFKLTHNYDRLYCTAIDHRHRRVLPHKLPECGNLVINRDVNQ